MYNDRVFALGLPCGDDDEEEHSGLSTGAKAGIGAGVAVGTLLLALAIIALWKICRRRRENSEKDAIASELPVQAAAAGGPETKHLSAATTMTPGSPAMYPALQTYSQSQTPMHQYNHPQVPEMGGYSNSHGYSPALGHGQAQMVQDQYGGVYRIQPAGMPSHQQPYPYPYPHNSPSLGTGQHGGGYFPHSPPIPAPPLQLYPYQPNQMSQPPNTDYQQQHSRPPLSDPVEADSGSFRPSSLSISQPLLASTNSPPLASASQPTSSVNGGGGGGQSAAELSSHGGSSGRQLIARKSVASQQHQNPPPGM